MCYMLYPTKPKEGWQRPCQVVVNQSTAQLREKKATQKFANRYRDIFQNNMAEGPKEPQGPFFYQEGGKTYASCCDIGQIRIGKDVKMTYSPE